jgi:hypothetical protein
MQWVNGEGAGEGERHGDWLAFLGVPVPLLVPRCRGAACCALFQISPIGGEDRVRGRHSERSEESHSVRPEPVEGFRSDVGAYGNTPSPIREPIFVGAPRAAPSPFFQFRRSERAVPQTK